MKKLAIALFMALFAGAAFAQTLGLGASLAGAQSSSTAASGGGSGAATAVLGLAAANNSGQAISGNVSTAVVDGNDVGTTSISEAAHTNTSTSGALGGALSGAGGLSGAAADGAAAGAVGSLFIFAQP